MNVSPDSTSIATGSCDATVSVWSLATDERMLRLGPLEHEHYLVAVKFSPDGRLIAITTRYSVRILRGGFDAALSDTIESECGRGGAVTQG